MFYLIANNSKGRQEVLSNQNGLKYLYDLLLKNINLKSEIEPHIIFDEQLIHHERSGKIIKSIEDTFIKVKFGTIIYIFKKNEESYENQLEVKPASLWKLIDELKQIREIKFEQLIILFDGNEFKLTVNFEINEVLKNKIIEENKNKFYYTNYRLKINQNNSIGCINSNKNELILLDYMADELALMLCSRFYEDLISDEYNQWVFKFFDLDILASPSPFIILIDPNNKFPNLKVSKKSFLKFFRWQNEYEYNAKNEKFYDFDKIIITYDSKTSDFEIKTEPKMN